MFTLHRVAIDICCEKSLGLVYLGKFRSSANLQKNNWCSLGLFLIYVYVLNAFLARKGSAILHGNKLFLQWFSALNSRDVTIMSMQFLYVGASKNLTF